MSMPIPINFLTVVWGKKYVQAFVDIVLPSLLAEGNLGTCKDSSGELYYIYTSHDDIERLVSSPAIKRLRTLLEVVVSTFDPGDAYQPDDRPAYWEAWQQVSRIYQKTAQISAKNGAALMLLSPDEVFADGGIRSIRRIAENGKKVIIINGLAARYSTIVPVLKRDYLDQDAAVLTVTPRELARLGREHMHEYNELQIWGNPVRQNDSGTFIFEVEGEGLIMRTFGSSPAYFVHREGDPPWPVGNGLEHIEHVEALYDWGDIYVLQDSDELALVGLERATFGDRDYKISLSQLSQPASVLRQGVAMKEWFNPSKIRVGNYSLRWHWTDLGSKWEEVEIVANRVIQTLVKCRDFFEEVPEALNDFKEHVKMIESLRAERKWWLELAAAMQHRIGELPHPAYILAALHGLVWLHVVEGRTQEAVQLLEKTLQANVGVGYSALSSILPLLRFSGQEAIGESLVDMAIPMLRNVVSQSEVANQS